MLISSRWIGDLLGLESIDPAELASVLTGLGLEIEGTRAWGEDLSRVSVAEVRDCRQHPDADKLSLVDIHDGSRGHTVVCGASNVPGRGGRVAFAPIGTTLPIGLTLEAREIRGVRSEGMLCSEAELDLGPDQSGILVLPNDWAPGSPLVSQVPEIEDTILEMTVTPNRPDALGHVGVARDVAIALKREVKFDVTIPDRPRIDGLVSIDAVERCGSYLGFVLTGVKVGPSPLWMRVLLHHMGLRPINNVVDITNYVLLQHGQPLHAFDRSRLEQGRVVVRTAAGGERLRTLDDRELELALDDLVIADAAAPQALAGVMGGMDSSVQEGTSEVLLEVAWFDPSTVRRSARRHDIHSDSSHRFERGVDYDRGLRRAAESACTLLKSLAGAKVEGWHEGTGHLPARPTIGFRPARCKALLGVEVPHEDIERIFRGLEIEVESKSIDSLACHPPTHRPDLKREEDLIEEVMRHVGVDSIPTTPVSPSRVATPSPPTWEAEARTRLLDGLCSAGLHEHISLVFASAEDLELSAAEIPLSRAVRVTNPLRGQTPFLRTHLLPGLLHALALNSARHGRPVRLFECGRVYSWGTAHPHAQGPTAEVDAQLPEERFRAGVLLGQSARGGDPPFTGSDAGGILLYVLRRMGYSTDLLPADSAVPAAYLHPGVQGVVAVRADDGARVVGRFGEVHPDWLERWDLAGTHAIYGEVFAEALPRLKTSRFAPLPRFPASSRDVSLAVPVQLPASVVVDALYEAAAAEHMAQRVDSGVRLAPGDTGSGAVELLEDYRGKGVDRDSKALLLRLHYRAAERSVTDAEVDIFHESVVSRSCKALAQATTAGPIKRR